MAKNFTPKHLVSPDGRVARTVTSEEEYRAFTERDGYTEGSFDKESQAPKTQQKDAETANAGREGNRRAAEASTTKTANDGVDRKATSGA